MHHPDDSPPPDRCPLCGSWVSADAPPEPAFMPQAPGIKKSLYAQSVDMTYREMERQSEARAEEAAARLADEYARQPKDEFSTPLLAETQKEMLAQIRSETKITDMKDPSEMREGDTAVKMPASVAAATANLQYGGSKPGFQDMSGGVPNYQPGVVGNGPRDNALSGIRTAHSNMASAVIRQGNMGTYKA